MKITHFIRSFRDNFTSSLTRRFFVPTLLLIFCSVQFGYATDYYFSSSSGNDSRSATEAQNSATPWKSIDKLNSISSTLKAGDRIFFKAGDVFYGTIKITKSGSSSAPIVYTSYGTGARPVITSLVRVTNLVSVGSGKYEANLSSYNIARMQVVTLNDQIKEVGRHPNTGAPEGGYLKISNANSATSITTASSNPYSGNSGQVVIRKNNWILDTHEISSISGNTITFKENGSHYTPQKNHGYFLQNHASLLDLPGEWSYDPATKKFTINLNGLSASSVNVSVASLDHVVTNSSGATNVSFSNLHFKGSNGHLMNFSGGDVVKIENCVLDYAGENAIQTTNVKGLLVQNNQINYSLNTGINASWGSAGAIIRGNTLKNSFAFQGMSKNSDLQGMGIYVASDADRSVIEKNTIINSGFNGIHFGGSYTKVVNNFIDNFCLYKQDAGGIYTNSDGMRDRNNVGREITGNIIINGKGTRFGTVEDVDMAEGIYLDDNSAGVTVSKNTIAFVSGKGIFLHNANNINIFDNVFYRAKSQVQFTHDAMGDPIRNVTISKNQFSAVESTEKVYSIYSIKDDIGSVGTINSNYFLDPFGLDFFILTKAANESSPGSSRNLSNWATNFGHDANSAKPALNVQNYKVTSSTLIKQSDFSSNTSIVAGVYGATSQLVSNGISGGTLRLSATSSGNATAYLQIGAVQAGDKIMIEFDMKGSPINSPVELFLEGTFNVDKGASSGKVSTTSSAKNNKVLLTSAVAKSNESIVFRFPSTVSELLLDNIKISKVTTEDISKESLIFFAYNPTGTAVQESLPGTYVNGKNETFSNSVSVPAYGSVLLAKVSGESAPVENKAPTISLSKPNEGQVFIKGVNPVELVANAQDPEGNIKQVEFYNGTTLLATVKTAPFSYNWTDIQNGTYKVTAKVIDEGNLSATSAAINFTVKDEEVVNKAPSVSLSKPTEGQVFTKGETTIQLVANASDPEGKIKQVEFYNGSTLLATVKTSPYTYTWSTIQAGSYKVTAKVIDEGNLSATSTAINFTVKEPVVNKAPSVSLSQPTEGQVFTKGVNTVQLVANASDPEGKIKQVEFYNGSTLLATVKTSPYTYTWSTIQAGSYKVTAKVIDEENLSATSTAINFTVKDEDIVNKAPSVSLSKPTEGQVFIKGVNTVQLVANASDPEGKIKQVEFYNGTTLLAIVKTAPFSYNWADIQNGTYKVTAKVIDEGNLSATSAAINFTVKDEEVVNKAPSVSLSKPTEGQVFTKGETAIQLVANASDPEGKIKQVEFYNGTTLLATVKTSPYTYTWSTIQAGSYKVTAKVIDEGNLSATSTAINFTVKEPVGNKAPSVSLSKPTEGQIFTKGVNTVQLVANASDPEGKIKQVEFYNGTTLLATVKKSPYTYTWSTIQAGSYKVTAKVIDEGNLSATSTAINFTVKEAVVNKAPSVSLSRPTEGQVFTKGINTVQLVANASDPEGKIKQVEFYNGTTLLATVKNSPYTYTWSTIQAGSYKVSAKVIDEGNLSATSTAVNFTVKDEEKTATPSYSAVMVSPANNSTIDLGTQKVVLNTNASTSGLTIKKVQYFNWGFPLVTVTSGNFDFPWTKVEPDNYSINAKVTDSNGNVYTTPTIKFTVKAASAAPSAPVTLAVNLSQPANNQTFTLGQQVVKLKADVTDASAVKSIQFYNWGFPLVAVNSAPFEFDWTKIEVGSYQIYAVATDVNGKTTTSNTIKFSVVAPTSTNNSTGTTTKPATVVMTSPADNQRFVLGKDPVVLKVNTSEPVSKVEFFNWYLPLVSVSNTNQFSWTKIELGEYFVSARITDSKGNVIDSEPVRFTVVSPNTRITDDESAADSTATDSLVKNGTVEQIGGSVHGIKMGPNPTSSHLNLFFEEYPDNLDGKVSVMDLRGVELFNANFNTDQDIVTLDLAFLKPGIYVVKVAFGDKYFQTTKLIKN
jgi:hypothetical protein